MRPVLAAFAGAAGAAIGALILGEYTFTGWPIFGACILFGLFIAEVVVTVGRRTGTQAAAKAAGLTGAGLIWAAWISSGRELALLPGQGWAAIALGTLAAGLMALWRPAASGNRTASSPAE